MLRSVYTDFLSYASYDPRLRRIMTTDIYGTSYNLDTEYMGLFTKANRKSYYLLDKTGLFKELQFYFKLDELTYLPFERLGHDYLSRKLEGEGISVSDLRYGKIVRIFNDLKIELSAELDGNIRYFFDKCYDDVIKISPIGLVIISLRLFHRYVTMMNFGAQIGGTVQIHERIGEILDKITEDVTDNGLTEIDINAYLPKYDFENRLSDEMTEYIELCLERIDYV